MIALLLTLTLFTQGPAALQSDNGTITGVLRTAGGDPAIGVRVAAMAIPESALDAVTVAAMISLVATDEAGRYRLENVPPGRYYISAGRVDFPTYFPGVLDMSGGTVVSITSKATIAGLNFALQDASIRTAAATDSYLGIAQPSLAVPVQVRVENGARQPVSTNGTFVTIGLTRTADGAKSSVALSGTSVSLPIPSAVVGTEYKVSVDNLPEGYVLKSITYGSTDLLMDTLKLTAANFLQLSSNTQRTIAYLTTTNGTPLIVNSTGITSALSGISNYAIYVTLETVLTSTPPPPGVRVTGHAPVSGSWSVYRGNIPGSFYADGTFELQGVPPGRHIILLQDDSPAPHFYAAVANVGDRDLDGVTLDSTGMLPTNMLLQPSATAPGNSPGSSQPLAGLIGRVIEEEGRTPVARGIVTVLGRTMATISLGSDGTFVIPHLLPGSYDLRVEVFEHFTLYQTVIIGEQDAHVDLPVRSNLATAAEKALAEATSEAEPQH
jgi:hypothetical protein